MNERNHEHTQVTSIDPDKRIEAIEIMAKLEEIQNANDDIIDSIARQSEAIEGIIVQLIKGGVHHS